MVKKAAAAKKKAGGDDKLLFMFLPSTFFFFQKSNYAILVPPNLEYFPTELNFVITKTSIFKSFQHFMQNNLAENNITTKNNFWNDMNITLVRAKLSTIFFQKKLFLPWPSVQNATYTVYHNSNVMGHHIKIAKNRKDLEYNLEFQRMKDVFRMLG